MVAANAKNIQRTTSWSPERLNGSNHHGDHRQDSAATPAVREGTHDELEGGGGVRLRGRGTIREAGSHIPPANTPQKRGVHPMGVVRLPDFTHRG